MFKNLEDKKIKFRELQARSITKLGNGLEDHKQTSQDFLTLQLNPSEADGRLALEYSHDSIRKRRLLLHFDSC